eukprot:tig00020614_g12193.t1
MRAWLPITDPEKRKQQRAIVRAPSVMGFARDFGAARIWADPSSLLGRVRAIITCRADAAPASDALGDAVFERGVQRRSSGPFQKNLQRFVFQQRTAPKGELEGALASPRSTPGPRRLLCSASVPHLSFQLSFFRRRPRAPPRPTRDEIGRAGWTLLHTAAASYPRQPTEQDKRAMRTFLLSFTEVYPCAECRKDFQQIVQRHPPRLESREDLSTWVCEVHNEVNRKVGKPAVPCVGMAERWRIRDCDGSVCSVNKGAQGARNNAVPTGGRLSKEGDAGCDSCRTTSSPRVRPTSLPPSRR